MNGMVGPILVVTPVPGAPRLSVPRGRAGEEPRGDRIEISPDARELARRIRDLSRAARDAFFIGQTARSASGASPRYPSGTHRFAPSLHHTDGVQPSGNTGGIAQVGAGLALDSLLPIGTPEDRKDDSLPDAFERKKPGSISGLSQPAADRRPAAGLGKGDGLDAPHPSSDPAGISSPAGPTRPPFPALTELGLRFDILT